VDEDRHANKTPPAAGELVPAVGAKRFSLEHAGRSIELRPGVFAAGRSSACQIAVDDALVSRRHAEFVVTADSLTVRDAGSVNGVFVNNKRIAGAEFLRDGDQVRLGTQVLVVRASSEGARPRAAARVGAETLRGIEVTPLASGFPAHMPSESEATFSAHTLDLLGGVAEKVLALGRGEEAEKVLSTTLTNLLSDVRSRGPGSSKTQVQEKAVHYALKLAEVTGKGRWVDYALELYAALKRPFAPALVDELYAVLRHVDAVNLNVLRAYVADLRALQQTFGPTERFVLQRLEGFERLAALK
jgi:pSer/pThr/pTyr-binding forkhead associated (FHA) protein